MSKNKMAAIIHRINNPVLQDKMAAFDYDWTLVRPKDCRTFSTRLDDWQWLYPGIPDQIKQMYVDGYTIVIFTNQSKKWKHEQVRMIAEMLEVPIIVVIAHDTEIYKPNPTIFNLLEYSNINRAESFFVGDALGREKDHSDCDRKFAENIGIRWMSPEQLFVPLKTDYQVPIIPVGKELEIIIMAGYPGSGKSTTAKALCDASPDHYEYISGDIYKTSTKMIKAAQIHLDAGKSIIFDATNGTIKKRQEYVEFAKLKHANVKCIHVTTTMDVSYMRNRQREFPVPIIAFSVYRKNFESPTEAEGFELYTL